MSGADDDLGALDGEFDPDAVLWVRGVDYISGWRDATGAVEELAAALAAVGLDMDGVRLRADAAPDGSGVVRLVCSASAARDLALLARVTAARLRRARADVPGAWAVASRAAGECWAGVLPGLGSSMVRGPYAGRHIGQPWPAR